MIHELEKEMKAQLQTGNIQVTIAGKVDRIDRDEKTVRIIDYKTGKADRPELHVKEWEQLLADHRLNKSFQLLCYAWLYQKTEEPTEGIVSAIISFRQLKAGIKPVITPGDMVTLGRDQMQAFDGILQQLIRDMFDTEKQFVQTAELDVCEYCEFRSFCFR